MSSGATHQNPTVHKRSRNGRQTRIAFSGTEAEQQSIGCYTCRVRKVRCGTTPPSSDARNGVKSDCSNCKRLGFQCRWHPPASGERYVPPPKRRRTAGNCRTGTNKFPTDSPPTIPNLPRTGEGSEYDVSTSPGAPTAVDHRPDPLLEQGTVTFNQFPDPQLGLLGDLSFNSDFILGYNPFDLDLAGEGLDFIPLPEVDPSILQSSADSTQATLCIEQSPKFKAIDTNSNHLTLEDMSNSTPRDTNDQLPSMNEDNRRLIQHYLEVMKGYSKVDDRTNKDGTNLFISAFSQSLCFPPLFYAILAFSASHLSILHPSYADQANTFDRLAEESFQEFKRDHDTEVEGLLSALFVRVKKVHVMAGSMDTFLDLIATAANIVSTKQGERALEVPSTLTRRIILRLAILDARAACYRLGGGMLIERLRHIPCLSFIFDRTITEDMSRGGVVNLLRANIFRMHVAELDKRLHSQIDSQFVVMPPLRIDEVKLLYADIRREIERCELELATQGKKPDVDESLEEEVLDATTYSYYTVLSVLHSGVLYLCDVYLLPSFERELSITKILHYQLKVQCDTSRVSSPSSIFPSSLFQAGLHTSDPIHRDWIIKAFKRGEEWGVFIRRARELLEAMLRMQSRGVLVDICSAMDEVTGRFII
ncbi:Fc.00g000720.m01.CDS01 [Cosmosporella sp. VM-42]